MAPLARKSVEGFGAAVQIGFGRLIPVVADARATSRGYELVAKAVRGGA